MHLRRMNYTHKLLPNKYYHVYNRAVGSEICFRDRRNFLFFLRRVQEYLYPVMDVIAYCLIPNHFHLLVRIKEEKILREFYEKKKGLTLAPEMTVNWHKVAMTQLKNMLSSFAKAVNKDRQRKGALFCDYTKRIEVVDHEYLENLIHYIHYNPVNHGFVNDPMDWEWSSFFRLLNADKKTYARVLMQRHFGSMDRFFHKHQVFSKGISLSLDEVAPNFEEQNELSFT
ncbi:MAG: hypothetical protein RLZZ77_2473 [Bacteroidota bacterium]